MKNLLMSTPLLSLRDLAVSFRREGVITPAVHSLSLDIHPGETVALVGESGSGKSVSALASLGLLSDNADQTGQISWKGSPSIRQMNPACAVFAAMKSG